MMTAAGGDALNVEQLFSTYVYKGNGSGQGTVMQTITNNIDLSGEGGMVWMKSRSSRDHVLQDTERGIGSQISSNQNGSPYLLFTNCLSGFNSNGFDLDGNVFVNNNNENYVSWTFRKAPKFFDVVTYTGDGVDGRTVSHNLGSVPGCIMVKATSGTGTDWRVYHRSNGSGSNGPEKYSLKLNDAYAQGFGNMWSSTQPTSTVFTVGNDSDVNGSGRTYVAYLFAHNNGDGEFGPTGDQDIIKCGSYSGNSNGEYNDNGTEVNLGFEPQWVMIKSKTWNSASSHWQIYDNMRGIGARNVTNNRDVPSDGLLRPNKDWTEDPARALRITPTGFKMETDNFEQNASTHEYIYVAIRRGPMAVPEDANDVFEAVTRNSSTGGVNYYTGFPVDMSIYNAMTSAGGYVHTRLTAYERLQTPSNVAAISGDKEDFETNVGYQPGTGSTTTNALTWNWKRAPNFFDVVTYVGTGVNRTISHNLGAAPEMMWIKNRDAGRDWCVYHKVYAGTDNFVYLNYNNGTINYGNFPWNSTAPTSSVFSVSNNAMVNANTNTYIAYLFASLDGVSKVGSYTGNGSSQNIDCGFSNGSSFIVIKKINNTGNWFCFDDQQGIVAGNDPFIQMNNSNAQNTSNDYVDPYSAGFTVNSSLNTNGDTYIFYAIA